MFLAKERGKFLLVWKPISIGGRKTKFRRWTGQEKGQYNLPTILLFLILQFQLQRLPDHSTISTDKSPSHVMGLYLRDWFVEYFCSFLTSAQRFFVY